MVPIEQTEPHASNGKSAVSIKQVQPGATPRVAVQHVMQRCTTAQTRPGTLSSFATQNKQGSTSHASDQWSW